MGDKLDDRYESYFDGIDPELQAALDKMTPDELEEALEKERKECERMTNW